MLFGSQLAHVRHSPCVSAEDKQHGMLELQPR